MFLPAAAVVDARVTAENNRKQIVRAAKDKYVPVLDILISEGVIRVPTTVFEL